MNYQLKENMRLLDALSQIYPDSSNRTLRNMIKAKRVFVDGKVAIQANEEFNAGQTLSVGKAQRDIATHTPIVFEDRDFVIINKPEGLLSVPLEGVEEDNLLDLLKEHYKTDQIYAVHRIDKGTSGIILFARGKRCLSQFNAMFREHKFEREYLAILQGNLPEDKGTWNCLLQENPDRSVSKSEDPEKAREAITHFEVLKRSARFTYVKCTLETGRKHQIRVHCLEAGYPIAGDLRYGDPECNPINRLALHAYALRFKHPLSNKAYSFTAPMPPPFKKVGFDLVEL